MAAGKRKSTNVIIFVLLSILTVIFMVPMALVLINSFKSRLYISVDPFAFPNEETFVGLKNYITGLTSSGFLWAFLRSLFITVASVILIVVCTAMISWYIVRVKNKFTKGLYYAFAFSMVVPFQMVMFTMTYIVGLLHLNNVVGIVYVYLGFGAGLSAFMFTGFLKSVPLEIEEAATIDGCNPLQCFFRVVFPIMKPTAITVAILNAMWIWNDYLLPYLVLGTVPVAIQLAMQGAYGSTDMGGFMAMLVLAIIPIIIFYVICQKYIIQGVIAGAVKG